MASSTQFHPASGRWSGVLTAALVIALVLATVVLLNMAGDLLIAPDTITLLVVSIGFFAVLAGTAAYGRERGQQARWLMFTIWWGLLVSEEVFTYRSKLTSAAEAEFATEAYAQAALWVIAFAALIVGLLKYPQYLRGIFAGDYKWVTWLTILSIVSCAYSPNPAFSLAWAFKLGLSVLLVHLCSREVSKLSGIDSFLKFTIWALVVLTVVPTLRSILEPDPMAGLPGELQQRFHEGPTAISGLAGLLLVLCLTLYSTRRRTYLLGLAALGFVLMLAAGGKAGIVAGFISGILFYGLQKRFKAVLGFVAIVLTGFAFALKFTALSEYFSTYMQLDQLSSFTGRTGLWAFVWPLIMQRPILGYGFNASRFIAVLYPETPFGSSHMHNSLLEALYNNGILGVLLILMVLFVIVRNLWRTMNISASKELHYLAIGCLAAFANLFINGMFNATFGGRPDASYMILIALVVISTQLYRLAQEESARQPVFSPALDSFGTPVLDPLS
jgi:O-antigen ligase